MVFDPIKHLLRVFLNGFKNIPEKACVERVHNNELRSIAQKTNSSVLSGFKTTRRSRVVLDPIKHLLRVFLNGFNGKNLL